MPKRHTWNFQSFPFCSCQPNLKCYNTKGLYAFKGLCHSGSWHIKIILTVDTTRQDKTRQDNLYLYHTFVPHIQQIIFKIINFWYLIWDIWYPSPFPHQKTNSQSPYQANSMIDKLLKDPLTTKTCSIWHCLVHSEWCACHAQPCYLILLIFFQDLPSFKQLIKNPWNHWFENSENKTWIYGFLFSVFQMAATLCFWSTALKLG